MDKLFLSVLNMSLTGAVVIATFILARVLDLKKSLWAITVTAVALRAVLFMGTDGTSVAVTFLRMYVDQYGGEQSVISIPLMGNDSYNRVSEPNAQPVHHIDGIFNSIELTDGTEVCWYLDGDVKSCAYRKTKEDSQKPDNAWMRFLIEKSAFAPQQYGLGEYEDLFGHSGFYIIAQRGGVCVSYDFYYFDINGALKMLYAASYPCFIGDINGDGHNELYWGYHDGRELYCTYLSGGEILTANINNLICSQNPDWRFDFQGSVFPSDYHGMMGFKVSFTDADKHQHIAWLVFTKDTVELYMDD